MSKFTNAVGELREQTPQLRREFAQSVQEENQHRSVLEKTRNQLARIGKPARNTERSSTAVSTICSGQRCSSTDKLNWDLTSSTTSLIDLRSRLNRSQGMNHELLHREFQQLAEDPYLLPLDTPTPNQRTPLLITLEMEEGMREQPFAHRGEQPLVSTHFGRRQPLCNKSRHTTIPKQIEGSGNFEGTPINKRTSFMTSTDGRSQEGHSGRERKKRRS